MGSRGRRAAVIGSGFGGLATAIRLQNEGFQVTIFEKRELAGGRAYVYRDKGFTELALVYARKLVALNPNEQAAQKLLESLR